RNPWRISFDRSTGDLWIADVGQGDIEEIDVAYAADGGGLGANLGWSLVEGTQPFNGAGPPAEDYLAPVYEYTHDEGCSVTGGYVYRGAELPELTGVYLFGDYCTSTVWGLLTTASGGFAGRVDLGLQLPGGSLVSFGEDADGELYVLSLAGVVYRLEAG
ncbi:MAG: PQQ-dependent sugar dehydrogenase, partial [Acidimicrobiales bacterium]|nr:PQQ-dependent sugar dehydrogenase [Acidimicrobiales bacterium]